MNPTFGASILSWIPPMWTPEGGLFAIQQASAAGFDLLEILLPPSMEFDAPTVKRQLKQGDLFSQPSPRSAYSFLSQGSDSPDQGGAG